MLQTANGKVLIARPIPPEGQKTGTDVFFSPITEDKLPALTELQANSTVKALVTFLTETAGITPNENVPPQGQSRSPLRATIDHTKFYLFQGQNQLSNKNLLFYRQEDSWAPQTIKDTLPYFLGAVGDDQLDRQLKLQRARRDLKLLERRLEDEEAIRGRDNSKGLALFGLVSSEIESLLFTVDPIAQVGPITAHLVRLEYPSANRHSVIPSGSDVASGQANFHKSIKKATLRLNARRLFMEAAGIECESSSPERRNPKRLPSTTPLLSAHCQHGNGKSCLFLSPIDASLRRIITAWPSITPEIKQEVEALCFPPASRDS